MYAIQMKMTVEETRMDKDDKIAAITASNLPEVLKAELLSKLVDSNEIERQRLSDAIRKEIVGILLSADHGMTPSELIEISPFLGQCSIQKISHELDELHKRTRYNADRYGYKVYWCKKKITEVRTYSHPDGSSYTVKTHRTANVWVAERA